MPLTLFFQLTSIYHHDVATAKNNNDYEQSCKLRFGLEFECSLSLWSYEANRAVASQRLSTTATIDIDFTTPSVSTEYLFQMPSELCVVDANNPVCGILVVIELLHK